MSTFAQKVIFFKLRKKIFFFYNSIDYKTMYKKKSVVYNYLNNDYTKQECLALDLLPRWMKEIEKVKSVVTI